MAKWFWVPLLLLSFVGAACSSSTAVEPSVPQKENVEQIFFGKWKVGNVIGYAHAGLPTEEKIMQKVNGKELEITAKSFKSGTDLLSNPTYLVTQENKDDFFEKNLAHFDELHIQGETVMHVKVTDPANKKWTAVGSDFYVLDKDSLFVNAAGYFVELTRE